MRIVVFEAEEWERQARARLGAAHSARCTREAMPQEPLIREEAQIFRGPWSEGHDLEALVANHVLLRLPNVVATPHTAYDTEAAIRRVIAPTLANIATFAHGGCRVKHPVPAAHGG